MRFGLQLWSQQTDWAGFRDAALAAEDVGWDSIWTWDHLFAIFGPWEQPTFEGWSVLAGLAPITKKVRLGLMVGANTFRNPGLTAKVATTLDHLSDGRAILGIGAAWFDREHDGFGIEFGTSPGWRIDRLDESVMLMRRLLDGERFSLRGPGLHVPRCAGRAAPRPGAPADPDRRLRAEEDAADRGRACGRLEHGRAPSRRSRPGSRSSPSTAPPWAATSRRSRRPSASRSSCATTPRRRQARFRELLDANGVDDLRESIPLLGSPAEVADAIRPYQALGFETVIVRMPAPYDRETIDRMAEVGALLGA